MLGEISTILGRNRVSILTVTQQVKDEKNVSLIFITHLSKEGDLQKSIKEIEMLGCVNSVKSIIRIDDFKS